MRRFGLLLALTLAATVLASGTARAALPRVAAPQAAVAAPQLQREFDAAGRGDMVKAIVVLKSQADLASVHGLARKNRPGAAARILRARADLTQRSLRALLKLRRAQGLVSDIQPLWIVNAIAVTATQAVISELAARQDVREIRPDLVVPAPPAAATATPATATPATVTPATATPAAAEPNVALVNAPALWDLGYRGQGIVVANMDTGVDVSHPDLASRWRGGTNSWYDPNGEHPATPTDISGHGTWTMGVMVGGDAGGSSVGIAPDATWIAVKIFNDRGTATTTGIHQGFQWLLDPDGNPATADAPDVVNNSWAMSASGCLLDFEPDLASLRAAGILPVFAAGNYGPLAGSSASPANNPEAFAVGATDDTDVLYSYSSRGPSSCGQPVYPQLTAPGVGIHTTDLYGLYADPTGTSVAAPHAAGVLALLVQAFPGISADRQAAALESGAVDLGTAGADNDYGYGRLNALAAYQWLATTPDFTPSVSPSSASTAAGGAVSYTVSAAPVNGFTGDVSLTLSGLPEGQASWSFSTPVIAGGSGSAQLTVSTAASIAAGTYPLTITATSGSTVHSAAATLVVTAPPDFSLSATPASRTVVAGAGATYTVGVASLNGFAAGVALSLTGLPPGVGTANFSPQMIAGAGSSQLTVTTLPAAPGGTYPLTITGTAGGVVHTVAATLVVSARDFALSVSPSSVSISRGKSAKYTVGVSVIGGSVGKVSLTVAGLPSGTTAVFSPNPAGSPGSSALTVKTTSSTKRGTYTLRITGTSGSLVHNATATLTVR
jgi:subtilisin family serine protease